MTAIAAYAGSRTLYLKLSLVALCWGGTFVAGRLLADSLPPVVSALGRYGIAATILVMLVWVREGGLPRLSWSSALTTFVLGLCGVYLNNLAFFEALSEMSASRTAIFVALNPSFTALLLVGIWQEKLPGRKWIGIGTALSGAMVVISRGDLAGMFGELSNSFGRGELFMMGAALSWSVYTIVGKRALEGMSALGAVSWASVWGCLMLLVTAGFNHDASDFAEIGLSEFGALFYLAVLGTVIPFVWYYQGVRLIGPDRTALFTNLVPVFGVLLGVLLLGEALSTSLLLGSALVLVGLALSNGTSHADSGLKKLTQ